MGFEGMTLIQSVSLCHFLSHYLSQFSTERFYSFVLYPKSGGAPYWPRLQWGSASLVVDRWTAHRLGFATGQDTLGLMLDSCFILCDKCASSH